MTHESGYISTVESQDDLGWTERKAKTTRENKETFQI